ncbi:hypothetical protein STEG23_003036 [Scotinomys teguina]
MDAETPPGSGSPEPPDSDCSRAGERKGRGVQRSRERKGWDRRLRKGDLETQRDLGGLGSQRKLESNQFSAGLSRDAAKGGK